MFISTAFADGIKSAVKSDSALSEYFMSQFENLTPWKIIIGLVMGLIIGLLIAFVYKRCYRGVLSPVVMCIKSNISLSMGMVGALSIVRFRTAVKDPMDTAYMFWALTMGILLGAELYVHAVAVALGISVILMLMTFVHFRNPDSYLLVVHYDDYAEQDITQLLRRTVRQRKLRSKTVTRSGAEMTVEVRLDSKQDLVSAVLNIEGVHDATLVACQVEAGT